MYTGLLALWAEIYGVGNLGAINSLYTALSVFASALGRLQEEPLRGADRVASNGGMKFA
jgi:hypothetical protein